MSTTFVFELNGAQQVPVVATSATSIGSVIYDSVAGTADYTITSSGSISGRGSVRRRRHPQPPMTSLMPISITPPRGSTARSCSAGKPMTSMISPSRWRQRILENPWRLGNDRCQPHHGLPDDVRERHAGPPSTSTPIFTRTPMAVVKSAASSCVRRRTVTTRSAVPSIRACSVSPVTNDHERRGTSEIDGGADTDKLIFDRTASSQNFVIDITTPATPQTLVDGTTVVNVECLDVSTGSATITSLVA